MVSIFKASKKDRKPKNIELTIDRLDHEGRGVCRQHTPVVFVPNTLPGEKCNVRVQAFGKRFWQGELVKVIEKSVDRVEPKCQYFEQCGGCQTQYAESDFMLEKKQQALDALIQKQLGVPELPWRNPLQSQAWQYRRKARLAIDAQNKNNIKVGFRAEKTNAVLDIDACPILDNALNALLPDLKGVIRKLIGTKYLGHISLLKGEAGIQVTLRFTTEVVESDRQILTVFSDRLGIKLMIEVEKNHFETLSKTDQPVYIVPTDKIKLHCEPNDFVQVNDKVNQKMVAQAIDWLSLKPEDKIADLFCGIGNFSLALAAHCNTVVGFEGVVTMVNRAYENARLNDIDNAEFNCLDINQPNSLRDEQMCQCNLMLLDPSRAGAKEVAEQLEPSQWQKVLYVSCHAGTFARDAKIMKSKGFEIVKMSVLDMFPQTSHVELMALFLPKHSSLIDED